jgi:hypothetical protein
MKDAVSACYDGCGAKGRFWRKADLDRFKVCGVGDYAPAVVTAVSLQQNAFG